MNCLFEFNTCHNRSSNILGAIAANYQIKEDKPYCVSELNAASVIDTSSLK